MVNDPEGNADDYRTPLVIAGIILAFFVLGLAILAFSLYVG